MSKKVEPLNIQGVTVDLEFLKDVNWAKLAYTVGKDITDFLLNDVVPQVAKLGGIVATVVLTVIVPVLNAIRVWLVAQLPPL